MRFYCCGKVEKKSPETIAEMVKENPEYHLAELQQWYESESERLGSFEKDLEKNIQPSIQTPIYLINEIGGVLLQADEGNMAEYILALSLYSSCNYSSNIDGMESLTDKYREIANDIKRSTGIDLVKYLGNSRKPGIVYKFRPGLGFRTSGGYTPGRGSIGIKRFPENYFENYPELASPIIDGLENEEFTQSKVKSLILHENTHSLMDKEFSNVVNVAEEDYNALNEAAGRTITKIYGKEDSPAKNYRSHHSVAKMQTAEWYLFEKSKEEPTEQRKVGKIRREATKLLTELENSSNSLESLIKSESSKEIQKISEIIFTFEEVELRTGDILNIYGLTEFSRKGDIQRLDEITENIFTSLDVGGGLFKNEISIRNIDSEEGERIKQKEQARDENLSEIGKQLNELGSGSDFRNLLSQFASSRKEMISIKEHLNQEINDLSESIQAKNKLHSKTERDTLRDLKQDKKEVVGLINDLSETISEIQKEEGLEKQFEKAEENLRSNIKQGEFFQILNDSNRTDPQKMTEAEKTLSEYLLATLEAYKTTLNGFREINKHVLELCRHLHGDIEVTEEDIDSRHEKYAVELQKNGGGQVLQRYKKEAEIEEEKINALETLTEDLYKMCGLADKEIDDVFNNLEEAERRIDRLEKS